MTLRVAIVAHAFPRYKRGGGELAAYREHTILRSRGVDSIFAGAIEAEGQASAGTTEIVAPGEMVFRTTNYDGVHEVWRDPQGVEELVNFIAAHRPDIVHFHHYWNIGLNTIVALRQRLPQARFVLTLHEMLAICIQHGWMIKTKGGLCSQYDRIACHACFPERTVQAIERRRRAYLATLDLMDAYVYPSAFVRGRYEAWGLDPQKGYTLENCLAWSEVRSARKSGGHAPDDGEPRRFGFFGAPTMVKGIDVLIRAAAVLQNRSQDAVICLYGVTKARAEEEFPDLRPQIEALGETICFMGDYEPSDVVALMKRCDWVVVPSIWWENSPVVIQEAMAAGVPLIVSNIGGMAEKVRANVDGLHFQVGDYLDLAEKMGRGATRALATELSASMARPISENKFLLGLQSAFNVPLDLKVQSISIVMPEGEDAPAEIRR